MALGFTLLRDRSMYFNIVTPEKLTLKYLGTTKVEMTNTKAMESGSGRSHNARYSSGTLSKRTAYKALHARGTKGRAIILHLFATAPDERDRNELMANHNRRKSTVDTLVAVNCR